MVAVNHLVAAGNKRPIELNGSVALVGNSDALIGKGFGKEIDQFDNVFRFNLCDLNEKYLDDIGSKVDYCFFSLNISTHKFPHPPKEQKRFIQLCRQAKIICYPKNGKNAKKFAKKIFSMTAEVDHINKILFPLTAPEVFPFSLRNHPRNGIKLLSCLLDVGIKPVLFGFDLENRGDNQHYFDDEIQVENTGAGHRPSVEYALLKALEAHALIELR